MASTTIGCRYLPERDRVDQRFDGNRRGQQQHPVDDREHHDHPQVFFLGPDEGPEPAQRRDGMRIAMAVRRVGGGLASQRRLPHHPRSPTVGRPLGQQLSASSAGKPSGRTPRIPSSSDAPAARGLRRPRPTAERHPPARCRWRSACLAGQRPRLPAAYTPAIALEDRCFHRPRPAAEPRWPRRRRESPVRLRPVRGPPKCDRTAAGPPPRTLPKFGEHPRLVFADSARRGIGSVIADIRLRISQSCRITLSRPSFTAGNAS